ncbi:hypothetical protein ACFL6U_20550 [Planctomycetota bacterium]
MGNTMLGTSQERLCWALIGVSAVFLCMGGVSGCGDSSTGRPVPVPAGSAPSVIADLTYTSRSIFAGPVNLDVNSLQVEDSLRLHVELLAMAEVPPDALDSIYDHVRLVISSPKRNMLAPVASLTPGARIGFADANQALTKDLVEGQGGAAKPVDEMDAVLPLGVVAEVTIESAVQKSQLGNRLRVLISRFRAPDPNASEAFQEVMELAMVRSGNVPGMDQPLTPNSEKWGDLSETYDEVTQRVILSPVPLGASQCAAVILPFAWDSPWARALVLLITLERLPDPSKDPAMIKEFLRCVNVLMEEEVLARSIHGESLQWAGCLQCLDQLVGSVHWRRALVYLTDITQAPLAHDTALSVPMSLVRDLAARIYYSYIETPAQDIAELSWLIEKQAYLLLLDTHEKNQDEQEEFDTGLEAILVRHAGQTGRQLSNLRGQLNEARDAQDFQRRLWHENRISLEDMSPAARVRAYEWLIEQGQEPVGYDPLASAKERRAALNGSQDDVAKRDAANHAKTKD